MAMTKALRRDPLALYTQLQARRVDLASALRVSRHRKDEPRVAALTAAIERVDEAIEKTVERLNEIVAADEEVEVEEGVDSNEAEADEGTEDAELEDEASLEESDDFLPDEEDPSRQHQDDVQDEEVVAEETGENPVAMKAGLRRDVGDLTADFLDNYSLAIHTKVLDFFDSLNEKALDLGEENADDGETSLREILRVEVGKRGLSRFEPVFAEWRADLIKKLSKTINEMFALPEEPEDMLLPMTPVAPPAAAPAPAAAPTAPAPAPTVAAVQASGRVSFVVRDFVPSGQRVPAKME